MNLRIGATVLAISMVAGASKADTVTGGTFQSWNTSMLASPGTGAYWNNNSGDGPNYNIGWCLAGGGNCKIPNSPGAIPYLSNGSGGSPSNFFLTSSGGPNATTMLASFTSQQAFDLFGWYTLVSGVPVTHFLFNGTATGTTLAFTVPSSSNYGFYLTTPNGTFYTQDSLDSNGDGFQHFALFQQTPGTSYYLGVEDIFAGSDMDYNDMIVHLTAAASVPEPAPLGIFTAAAILLCALIRRKRAAG